MKYSKLKSIKKIKKPKFTYNLHIKDNHNYFADGINVSNCHTVKGESLDAIIKKATQAEWKIGMTGTIPRTRVDKLQLLGTLGKVHVVITPGGLIERGLATPIFINALYLNYSNSDRDLYNRNEPDYKKETRFIENHHYRNKKVSEILIRLANKGNVLGLFSHIAHGEKLLKNCIEERTGTTEVELLHKITPKPIKEAFQKFTYNDKLTFYMNTPISDEDRKKILKNTLKVTDAKTAEIFVKRIKSLDEINIFFITGEVSGDTREYIRKNLETIHIKEILLEFGDISIKLDEDEDVPLENGLVIKAKNITEDSDVQEEWIHKYNERN